MPGLDYGFDMCVVVCALVCFQRNYFPVSQAKATDIQGAHSTVFRHLLAISLGHKTDVQQNTRTLPASLSPSLCLCILSFSLSLPRFLLSLFPSHISLSLSASLPPCLYLSYQSYAFSLSGHAPVVPPSLKLHMVSV